MQKFIPALAIAATLFAAPHATAETTIRRGYGGEILEYADSFHRHKSSAQQVRILGSCLSACTMYLGLPNACVAPWAKIGIHKIKGDGPFLTIATQLYLHALPAELHPIYDASGHRFTMIIGRTLIRRGIVKSCPKK